MIEILLTLPPFLKVQKTYKKYRSKTTPTTQKQTSNKIFPSPPKHQPAPQETTKNPLLAWRKDARGATARPQATYLTTFSCNPFCFSQIIRPDDRPTDPTTRGVGPEARKTNDDPVEGGKHVGVCPGGVGWGFGAMVREWLWDGCWGFFFFFFWNVGQQKMLGDKNKWGGGKEKETHTITINKSFPLN